MRFPRLISSLLLVNLIGCTTWTTVNGPLEDFEGEKVRLTTHGGNQIEGRLVHADSLGSVVLVQHTPQQRRILDASDVTGSERRIIHEGHTVGLLTLTTIVAVFTVIQFRIAGHEVIY